MKTSNNHNITIADKIVLILIAGFLFISCKKENDHEPASVAFDKITVEPTDTLFGCPPILTIYSKALPINTINSKDYDSIVLSRIYRVDGAPLAAADGSPITDFAGTNIKIDRYTGIFVLNENVNLKPGLHEIDIAIFKNGQSRIFKKIHHASIEGKIQIINIPIEDKTITVKSGEAYTSAAPEYELNGSDSLTFYLGMTDSEGNDLVFYATKEEWLKKHESPADLYGVEVDKQGRFIVHADTNIPAGKYSMTYWGNKTRTWKRFGGSYTYHSWYYAFPGRADWTPAEFNFEVTR